MFAMELATRWRKDLTWRCFLAAAITIVVVGGCLVEGRQFQVAVEGIVWADATVSFNCCKLWQSRWLEVVGGGGGG